MPTDCVFFVHFGRQSLGNSHSADCRLNSSVGRCIHPDPLSRISYCIWSVPDCPLKIEHVFILSIALPIVRKVFSFSNICGEWYDLRVLLWHLNDNKFTQFHFAVSQHNFTNFSDLLWHYCLFQPTKFWKAVFVYWICWDIFAVTLIKPLFCIRGVLSLQETIFY